MILKIAGRCNMNCGYCYMYNLADRSHVVQPTRMSIETVDAVFDWVEDYSAAKGLSRFHVILHGGEPLLAGPELVEYIAQRANGSSGVLITISMLTNGLLLDDGWLNLLARQNIPFSISLDGPRKYHDRFRLTRAGEGTHERVEKKIRYLLDNPDRAPTYTAATLCVLSADMDGREVVRYFHSLGLRKVDFLLPDQNHVHGSSCYRKPTGQGEFAKVLIDAYDEWCAIDDPEFRIRKFELLTQAYLGMPVTLDSVGNGPITVFTVETNGEVEPVDSMKSCGDGYTKSGLNIAEADPDSLESVRLIRLGLDKDTTLPRPCRTCRNQAMCGGGYLPHRFDGEGFRETVYCADMMMLCDHIRQRVDAELRSASQEAMLQHVLA